MGYEARSVLNLWENQGGMRRIELSLSSPVSLLDGQSRGGLLPVSFGNPAEKRGLPCSHKVDKCVIFSRFEQKRCSSLLGLGLILPKIDQEEVRTILPVMKDEKCAKR